ncbi:MAG: hypothetical protein N3G20_01855, partial [Verrucomicrobiae bacterium]|nr:hypothetical protein [Verrucomicrobiae bacterium]
MAAPDHDSDCWSPLRFGILLAVLLVVQYPTVVLGTHSFFHRDFGVLAWPVVWYHRTQLWAGEIPLWNPLSHCGVPFLAQWGTMVLYPGSILYLLLPVPWSLNVFCLGHLWLGGFGMYRLVRYHGANQFAAAVAGIVFAFNGLSISCLSWPNYSAALGWLPWVIGSVEKAVVQGRQRVAGAVVIVALQMLTGAPEIILFTWIIVFALAAREVVVDPRRWKQVAKVPVVLLLAVGASAVQLVPFLDLFYHSQRMAHGGEGRWALPVSGLSNLLVPLLYRVRDYQGMFVLPGQEFFGSIYIGCCAIALAANALFERKVPQKGIWLVVALTGLWLALGEAGGAWTLVQGVPPFNWIRYPVKLLILTMAGVSWLSGVALRNVRMETGGLPVRQIVRFGVLFCAAACVAVVATMVALGRHARPGSDNVSILVNLIVRLICLAGFGAGIVIVGRTRSTRTRVWASLGAVVMLWLDYRTHMPGLNPVLPTRLLLPGYARPGGAPGLVQGRVFVTPEAEETLLESHVSSLEADYVGKRLALWSNLNLLESVPKVNGAATLRIREQDQVESILYGPGKAGSAAKKRLVDFLGATFCTSQSNVTEWVENPSARPIITAGKTPVFVSEFAALSMLAEGSADLDRVVLLPHDARVETDFPGQTETPQMAPKIAVWRFSASVIEFDLETTVPVWVVIAQTFDHNWIALVNGRRTKLWRANHAFQA